VEILQLQALRFYLDSLPCRTQLSTYNRQLTTNWMGQSESEPESEPESLYDRLFTANQFVLATRPLRLTSTFFHLNTWLHSSYVTSSLTRGLVCRLQMLLALASTVILRSDSRGTRDRILLSQILNSPNLEGQVPIFLSPRTRWSSYTSSHWVPSSSPPTIRRATDRAENIVSNSSSIVVEACLPRRCTATAAVS
jgi:hypothetical protein